MEAPHNMGGEAPTPAAQHLFSVNDNPDLLSEDVALMFHHIVTKSLFLSKHRRPDLQTAIAFLSTRVKMPDSDDYKKLGRMIKYMRSTKDLVLTLSADPTQIIQRWIDGSYAVHPDMRGHTGAAMTMGAGVIYGSSTKQRLNTRSSTEAELVAVDDLMPPVL